MYLDLKINGKPESFILNDSGFLFKKKQYTYEVSKIEVKCKTRWFVKTSMFKCWVHFFKKRFERP